MPLREGESITVGREQTCDVVVADPTVSRMHAIFSASSSGVLVADQSSLNGTFVNGERIQNIHDISSRDMVNIGPAKVSLELRLTGQIAVSGRQPARSMTEDLVQVPLTAVVVSVRNADVLAQRYPGARLRMVLDLFTTAVTAVAEQFLGKVESTVGKSVLLVWAGGEQRAQVRNALSMAKLLREQGVSLEGVQTPLELAMLVSSGVGMMRRERSGKYEGGSLVLLGDPVHDACELESFVHRFISDSGSLVMVDEETEQLGSEMFGFLRIGPVVHGRATEQRKLFILE